MSRKRSGGRQGMRDSDLEDSVQDLMSFPIPAYFPVSIDVNYGHLWYAISQCLHCHNEKSRQKICEGLANLWTSKTNSNPIMPLLSVRTGFDLFLRAKNFPPGSEVIMSAVNIPDMEKIVLSHNLVIVSLDISIDTLEPKLELLPSLISEKTVALVLTHLYGRWMNVEPFLKVTKGKNIAVVEDCAECFSGFDRVGHPDSDISLFSFGTIKCYTSFGGCVAKIRDPGVLKSMQDIHKTYPFQTTSTYLNKLLKFLIVSSIMQTKPIPSLCKVFWIKFSINYKAIFQAMLRGFPDQMLLRIRAQPSTALLATMLSRQRAFSQSEFSLQRIKGDYFLSNLPAGYEPVGHRAMANNHWLFPVLLEDPDTVVHMLGMLGVDAYRGATQLNLIESSANNDRVLLPGSQDSRSTRLNERYPHEAKYLIDHVIYLPVHKFVPFHDLDLMLRACQVALELSRQPDCKSLRTRSMLLKSRL